MLNTLGTGYFERQLSILREVITAITCTSNLDSIINLILDLALEYTGAKSGSILLIDESGQLLLHAARGMDRYLTEKIRVKVGEQICGKVARDRRPLYVRDVKEAGIIERGSRYRGRSFICCPIIMKDTLLGVININEKSDNRIFTDEDFDFTRLLSFYAAVAIEQARLISKLKKQREDLDRKIKELIDAERIRTEFISNISHELRTPLNAIKGALYYLKDKEISRIEEREFLNIVSSEADRLIYLVDTLLEQYIPDTHERLKRKSIIDLKDAVSEALETPLIQELVVSRGISINLGPTDRILYIAGDKLRLVKAFIYILSAIVPLMPYGESLQIGLSGRKKKIELNILAHGLSLPDERLQSLFDERAVWYYREDRILKLRLYIAKKVIEQHTGILNISNTDRGLLTTISIRRTESDFIQTRLSDFFKKYINYISTITGATRCSILLYNRQEESLLPLAAAGIDEDTLRDIRVKPGEGISGKIYKEGLPHLSKDIESDPAFMRKNASPYTCRAFISVPLKIKGRVIGVLNLTNTRYKSSMEETDLMLSQTIARKIAYLIEEIRSPRMDDGLFRRLSESVDTLIQATRKYSKDGVVTDLVARTMKRLTGDNEEIERAIYASKIYDIGLTQIDDNIISKPGRLSKIEKKIIRTHPFPAVRLLRDLDPDLELMRAILHHHERYDGKGYPARLSAGDIPLLSSVLSVVDSYVAMTEDRPYRRAMDRETAIKEVIKQSGSQFDPHVVEAFIEVCMGT